MPYSLPIAFLQMDADPGCLTAFSPIGSNAETKTPLTSSSLQVYTFALVFAAMVLVVAASDTLLGGAATDTLPAVTLSLYRPCSGSRRRIQSLDTCHIIVLTCSSADVICSNL